MYDQSTTYNDSTMAEDVSDIIYNMAATETSFQDSIKKGSATATLHEWQTEGNLAVDSTFTGNAALVEGDEYAADQVQQPVRKFNYTQIIARTFKVSETDQAVKKHGIADQYARKQADAMLWWKQKLEVALIHGVRNAGSASTARKLGGFFDQTTTNAVNAASAVLTQKLLDDYLQQQWNSTDTKAFTSSIRVGGALKRVISGFNNGGQRNVDTSKTTLTQVIDVYEGDFGTCKLFLHRFVDLVVSVASTYNMMITNDATWSVDTLRAPQKKDLPSTGDYKKGVVVGEVTLAGLYEAANVAVKALKAA